jgi:hypothetical protein
VRRAARNTNNFNVNVFTGMSPGSSATTVDDNGWLTYTRSGALTNTAWSNGYQALDGVQTTVSYEQEECNRLRVTFTMINTNDRSLVFGLGPLANLRVGNRTTPALEYLPDKAGVFFGSIGLSITAEDPFTTIAGLTSTPSTYGIWGDAVPVTPA